MPRPTLPPPSRRRRPPPNRSRPRRLPSTIASSADITAQAMQTKTKADAEAQRTYTKAIDAAQHAPSIALAKASLQPERRRGDGPSQPSPGPSRRRKAGHRRMVGGQRPHAVDRVPSRAGGRRQRLLRGGAAARHRPRQVAGRRHADGGRRPGGPCPDANRCNGRCDLLSGDADGRCPGELRVSAPIKRPRPATKRWPNPP